MASRFTIVGLGEALFDVFPDKQVLGGAPLNVAVHAQQLAAGRGGQGVVVTRVGQDALGRQIEDELTRRGMDRTYVQADPDRPTGTVYVSLDDGGQPAFEIVNDVAWDWLQFDPDLEDLARRCDAVCFGSLAQRSAQARNTIYRFVESAGKAVRMFDVNLRQQFYDRQRLHRSCEIATVLKLNHEELPKVADLLGVPTTPAATASAEQVDAAVRGLMKRYPRWKAVVLTRGQAGTVLYMPSGRHETPPVSYPAAHDADAVGAGDACAAAILLGMVLRLPPDRVVTLANHAGAYVASQPGATPALPATIIDMLK